MYCFRGSKIRLRWEKWTNQFVLITGLTVNAPDKQEELSIFDAVLLKPILFADFAATLHQILVTAD